MTGCLTQRRRLPVLLACATLLVGCHQSKLDKLHEKYPATRLAGKHDAESLQAIRAELEERLTELGRSHAAQSVGGGDSYNRYVVELSTTSPAKEDALAALMEEQYGNSVRVDYERERTVHF